MWCKKKISLKTIRKRLLLVLSELHFVPVNDQSKFSFINLFKKALNLCDINSAYRFSHKHSFISNKFNCKTSKSSIFHFTEAFNWALFDDYCCCCWVFLRVFATIWMTKFAVEMKMMKPEVNRKSNQEAVSSFEGSLSIFSSKINIL